MEAGNHATTERIVRARLTLRGLRYMENNGIARCTGTSARSSQKVSVSEAVRCGWGIFTAGVANASLQQTMPISAFI